MKKIKEFLEATVLVASLPVVVYAELNHGGAVTGKPVMAKQNAAIITSKRATAAAENNSNKAISIFSLVTKFDL